MKTLLLLLSFLLVAPVMAQEVDTEVANAEIKVILEKEMDLPIGDVDVSGEAYTVGADIKIDKLVLSPKIGLIRLEMVGSGIDTGSSVGLCVGLDSEYYIGDLGPFKGYAVGSYQYANTEVNIHDYEIGVRGDIQADLPYGLTPYLGVVLSGSKSSVMGLDLEAERNIGFRGGIKSQLTEDFSLNLGGSLIDETSITIAGSYKS